MTYEQIDNQMDEIEEVGREQLSQGQMLEEIADEPVEEIEGEGDEVSELMEETAGQSEFDDTSEESESNESSDAINDADLTVESVIEAILFASDEPLTAARLVNVVETGSIKQVRKCVEDLNKKYEEFNCAFRIERIAGGYQMMTLGPFNHWLKKLLRVRTDTKLSQAALETLAIISYKQPIIRADIEAIRGVGCGEMIRSLMYKGLVKIVGRAEVLGRPMLYGTTKKFLDIFGLNTLKDLPKIDELKEPKQ